MRTARGAVGAAEVAHLRRARDLVDRACAEPLDVAALARHAHVSEAHFSRRFNQAFGETPHQYVLSRRVERAQQLLRDTEVSVTDICLQVGFHSLGSFSSAFHRVTGTTPTAYRVAHAGTTTPVPGCWAAIWTRPVPSSRTAGMEKRDGPGAA